MTRKPRKRRLGLSKAGQARAGWWLGWLMVAAGIYLAFGLPPALMTFGVVFALTFLVLHDVEEPDEEVRTR
ncbi:hypothetical protein AB0M54_24360 [Actinoplanes sp. NPDC051470]|uniref:hypothetical protein n=1 Tax=Actinoplanes sp. NPDC051470 TaxID=3157224 RepID=UPI0034291CC6